MQVIELSNVGLKQEYKITIANSDVEKVITEQVNTLSKQVKLTGGFRPGTKIYIAEVKKRYKDQVNHETVKALAQKNIDKLLQDKKIIPATRPIYDVTSFEEGQDLELKVSFEVLPEVTIPELSKINLTKLICEFSDEDTENSLSKIVSAYKKFEPSNKTKAEHGDAVKIDFEGKVDGELIANGSGKDHQLELGKGSFIPGFEEQLIGHKAGDDVTVKLKFPDQYHSQDLAGKDAEFKVTIHEILSPINENLDDEFAKKFGLSSLEELKNKVNEQMTLDADTASKAKLRKDLFDSLEKMCDFPVPEGMVSAEFEALWERVKELKKSNPNYSSKSDEDLENVYRKMSHRRVMLGILLSEIAKQQNFSISQDELRQAVYNEARNYQGQEHSVIEFYRNNPQAIDNLKGPILEDKAVDYVLGLAKVSEKNVPFKDFPDAVKINEDDL